MPEARQEGSGFTGSTDNVTARKVSVSGVTQTIKVSLSASTKIQDCISTDVVARGRTISVDNWGLVSSNWGSEANTLYRVLNTVLPRGLEVASLGLQ